MLQPRALAHVAGMIVVGCAVHFPEGHDLEHLLCAGLDTSMDHTSLVEASRVPQRSWRPDPIHYAMHHLA